MPLPEFVFGVDGQCTHGLLPEIEPEMVRPAVETASVPEGFFNQGADSLIAPGDDAFQKAHAGVMPFDIEMPVPEMAFKIILFFEGLDQINLSGPLERSVGLRHKSGQADRDLTQVLASWRSAPTPP